MSKHEHPLSAKRWARIIAAVDAVKASIDARNANAERDAANNAYIAAQELRTQPTTEQAAEKLRKHEEGWEELRQAYRQRAAALAEFHASKK